MIGRWYFTYAILAASGFAAFALCIKFLQPHAYNYSPAALSRLMAHHVSRREAIFLAVLTALALGGGSILRRWSRKGRPMIDEVRAGEVNVPIYPYARPGVPIADEQDSSADQKIKKVKWNTNLTAHSRTGVVHHIEVCARHLPKPGKRTTAAVGSVVHHGWEAAILYQSVKEIDRLNALTYSGYRDRAYAEWMRVTRLRSNGRSLSRPRPSRSSPKDIEKAATEIRNMREDLDNLWKQTPERFAKSPLGAINRMRTEKMIAMLLHAIDLQPWSYHLHHRLIRIYGRFGRYREIRRLIQRSQQLATEAVKHSPRAKNIVKAKKEFDSWTAKLDRRKAASEQRAIENANRKRLAPSAINPFGPAADRRSIHPTNGTHLV
jgi:hypothetical protein